MPANEGSVERRSFLGGVGATMLPIQMIPDDSNNQFSPAVATLSAEQMIDLHGESYNLVPDTCWIEIEILWQDDTEVDVAIGGHTHTREKGETPAEVEVGGDSMTIRPWADWGDFVEVRSGRTGEVIASGRVHRQFDVEPHGNSGLYRAPSDSDEIVTVIAEVDDDE